MDSAHCSRCETPLGERERLPLARICQNCLNALSSDELAPFLESVSVPAAFVRRDYSVIVSNTVLSRLMGKLADDVSGLRIGEALECAYSETHEGCGRTTVCHQCGIKRMIDVARITEGRFSEIPLVIRRRSGIEQKVYFTFANAGERILVLARADR